MRRVVADRLFTPYNDRGAELSLVLFTLVAQAVAGAVVYLFISGTPQTFRLQFTLLFLFLLAQAFSFLHLGRKGNAFGSVRGLGHSWLSAEITALGLLAALLGGMSLLTLLDGVPPWVLRLGLGAEVLGAVLVVYCMINCYRLPARPLWNTLLTPVSFLASANLLGLHLYLALTGGAFAAIHALNVAGTLLVLLAVQSAILRRFGFWPALMQPVGDWRDVRALYVLRLALAAMVLLATIVGAALGPLFVLVVLGEFFGRVLFYKLSPATQESEHSMSENAQLIFVVDIERCVKCRACETSCKIANGVDRGDIFYRKVRILEGGTYPNPTRQFVSMSCNHCTDPPCVRGCPTEARTRHPETGVLSLNQEICMGCQYCTWACPYGAISYNPAKGVVEQCDFCAERRQDGLDPACVTACMSGALQYGTRADFDMSDLTSDLPGTPQARISDPNIYYRTRMGPSRRLHNDVYLERLKDYTPSLCMLCGSQCGVMVKTEEEKVVDIRPNPHCPNNISNNSEVFQREASDPYAAKLCAKGYSAAQALDDPDRVRAPLKRLGERGEGRWQEISWEQAFDEIADRLDGIRRTHGAHTLVWMTEDASYIPIQQDICAAFGTPNFLMHSNLCDVSRKAGCELALGHSRPLADLSQTRLAVLFGWNLVAAIKWSHLVPDLTRAREQGAELIVVDPVFSDTAAKADRWIPIRPGTDGALALAIAHVLIREDLIDHAFLGAWTTDFEAFAERSAAWTPEWAEGITGVPAADILWLARRIGTVRPAVVDGWSGPSHRSNGTLNLYAITLLNALIGMVDEPGGLHIPDERPHLMRRPPHPDWPEIREPRVDLLESYPLGHESGVYTEAVRAILEGTPYQPRALVLNFQNPVLSIPDRGRTVRALMHPELELIVSLDTMMSDSAALADYVIPGTVYLERTDLNVFWLNFAAVGLRQPLVTPRFGQPTEPDFIIGLARRLGLPGFDMDYPGYLDDMLRRSLGLGIEELRSAPGAVWVGGETAYRKYARETEGRPKGFATPSGLVEFRSAKLKGLADHRTGEEYSGFPEHLAPEVDVDDEYPLYLVNWKQAEHTHSRTQNNAWLSAMKPDNRLWINAVTARRIGLVEGEEVELESPFGRGRVRVHLTEGIHPDVVGLQHGFGAREMGRNARGRGISDNVFFKARSERLSGMAIHKETKVRVSPVTS